MYLRDINLDTSCSAEQLFFMIVRLSFHKVKDMIQQ